MEIICFSFTFREQRYHYRGYNIGTCKEYDMNRIILALTVLTTLSFVSPATSDPSNYVSAPDNTPVVEMESNAALTFDTFLEELYTDAQLGDAGLNFDVFAKAATGFYNLKDQKKLNKNKNILSVIDFGMSSSKKRLWIVDLDKREILYNTYVAHGRGSGDDMAVNFSNIENSHMSSLGFYVTENTYFGKHGLSLKLEGQDANFNSQAKQRAIVIHGADYVSEDFIKRQGRLGRSHGCPALSNELSPEIIQLIKEGTCLYIDAPSKNYQSAFLDTNAAVKNFQASLNQTQASL